MNLCPAVGKMPKRPGKQSVKAVGVDQTSWWGIKHFLEESKLAEKVRITLHTDSTAGKSMASRFGTSKRTRHVQLRYLFVQHLVLHNLVTIRKIDGTSNTSDVFTKYVKVDVLHQLPYIGFLIHACMYTYTHTGHYIPVSTSTCIENNIYQRIPSDTSEYI